MEDLDEIQLNQYLARALKELTNPPLWTECEKAVIAWAICFDGYISPREKAVGLGVTDTGLMDAWWRLVKGFGVRGDYVVKGDGLKWRVTAVREVLYVLVNIYSYLPDKRKRARQLMDCCMKRTRREVNECHT